MYKIVTVS